MTAGRSEPPLRWTSLPALPAPSPGSWSTGPREKQQDCERTAVATSTGSLRDQHRRFACRERKRDEARGKTVNSPALAGSSSRPRRPRRRRRHRWCDRSPRWEPPPWRCFSLEGGGWGGGAAGPPASLMTRMQRAESSFLVNLGLSPWSNGGHLGRRLGYITCL